MADVASFAVELRDVGKRFGSVVALDRVDLEIRKGEFFSLLGPSGCGKTTTLNLIGGFETASRGTLLIDGQPMGDTPSHARPVNTVFQSGSAGWRRCSAWSRSRGSRSGGRASSAAGSGSGWRWPAP